MDTLDVNQKFRYEILKDDMNDRCKEYGIDPSAPEIDLTKLGEEGDTIEYNCTKHEGKPERIMRFLNKVYNEFKMVQDLKHENIITYKYFMHMCVPGYEKCGKSVRSNPVLN